MQKWREKEALKAVEQMKTPEPRATRGNKIDYAALADKKNWTKK